jgi:homoserine O-acetyltransferase/O-succinyltransferase
MSDHPKLWKYQADFSLECGITLPEIEIAYHTYGTLAPDGSNVVWICHALTGNADAADWWNGLVGPGRLLDPAQFFIVCANMLGSCYGSTGPDSIDPATGEKYKLDFPTITIRDMVAAHELLRQHLGINRIYAALGGSMGGQQVVEWAIEKPGLFKYILLLATNAEHSPWGIAFNESQRMAIRADLSLYDPSNPEAGKKGLEAARAVAMLSYRSYDTYLLSQKDDPGKIDDFRASSYQRYQGTKLWQRFSPYAYLSLSKSMDSHNVGRGRGSAEKALGKIQAKALVLSISSDLLFPPREQEFLAAHIPGAQLATLDSIYGHDGFLVEFERIETLFRQFLFSPDAKVNLNENSPAAWSTAKMALPGSEAF